jgi:uncharacterized coiled-coil protein SlyX
MDGFEVYERKIDGLEKQIKSLESRHESQRETIREYQKHATEKANLLLDERDDNRRLRDACRQTNKGIHRLSKRCASQAKKIAELKAIVREAMSRVDYEYPQHWVDAVNGRRPAEKAT